MLEKVNSPADIKGLNIKELKILSNEIREFLIQSVTQTGGHLSSNLGVVELTIALHTVFECPKDEIIWDVGHQSYVHKIITGRKACFDTLRKKDGLSGYPCPAESEYDVIHAGHSSTSISIASGIARAKILSGDLSDTIAVIGDGAFTAGMVYEALNTIAHDNLPVVIVLNDNGMSISKNVGGISRYLKKLLVSHSYLYFKRRLEQLITKRVPKIGRKVLGILYRIKEFFKTILLQKNFFEDLGISYYGPIDGHDLKTLIETFRETKSINKPIIIHIATTKGKGYEPSEENPGKYHGISGKAGLAINGDGSIPLGKEQPSYSEVFGKFLCRFARKDDKVIAITAAMKTGTGLKEFADEFPERFTDVGIAEQHAITYSVGLALKGYKPVVCIYSTFLQRGFDQMVHDAGISKAKVLFCLDRAGLVPGDGETHQGVFDIAYSRMIPNFSIMLPCCKTEFEMMLEYALSNMKGPTCIRYPKDEALDYPEYPAAKYPIETGKGRQITTGKDVILVITGAVLDEALKACKSLKKRNIEVEIFNLRFAKPVHSSTIEYLYSGKKPVLILEEGVSIGGISEYLTNQILSYNRDKTVRAINLPDEFPSVGTREELFEHYCLTSIEIENKIIEMLNVKKE